MFHPKIYKPLFGFYDEENSAGFDLNRILIHHPSATFFVRIKYASPNIFGILSGDVAIVDRSIRPMKNSPVLIFFNGKFAIKSFFEISRTRCDVWGVITYVIHSMKNNCTA